MLLEDYERVSQAPTREALRDALVAFAEHIVEDGLNVA